MADTTTRGRVLLARRMAVAGLTQEAAAIRLEVSRQTISQLLAGKMRPGIDLAARLERKIGVPAIAWTEPA